MTATYPIFQSENAHKLNSMQFKIKLFHIAKENKSSIKLGQRLESQNILISSHPPRRVPVAENTIGNHDLSARKYVAGNCKCFGHTNQFC